MARDIYSWGYADYYVYDDNTIGYVMNTDPLMFGPLASNIQGLNNMNNGPVYFDQSRAVLAKPTDFDRFRLSPPPNIVY